ncbi:MAG: tetratricopeptide repeat protein [Candidatus Omnitrophica bacterium]|nr:tetratricopeptide repeat protein [Candidatus Omnitrophota bacterium]MDD5653372.1 tetratricopeptide repeat protein [Candidatus Omnitrophota bacterium]
MYSNRIRVFLAVGLVVAWGVVFGFTMLHRQQATSAATFENAKQVHMQLSEGLRLLKDRKDRQAMQAFEMILVDDPENISALWGKAEVLRRTRKFDTAESILKGILEKDPQQAPALISLAYVRLKCGNKKNALDLINQVLEIKGLDDENAAMAYLMKGTINSEFAESGWVLNKFFYGTQIKGNFLKAKKISPDLPEVRLGIGTFYLLAPSFAGGNEKLAIDELEAAVRLAPDFATANARLAQAYQKAGNQEKYNFYLARAKLLDPENEVFAELK